MRKKINISEQTQPVVVAAELLGELGEDGQAGFQVQLAEQTEGKPAVAGT